MKRIGVIEKRIADVMLMRKTSRPRKHVLSRGYRDYGYYDSKAERDVVYIDDGGNSHYFLHGTKIIHGCQYSGKWIVTLHGHNEQTTCHRVCALLNLLLDTNIFRISRKGYKDGATPVLMAHTIDREGNDNAPITIPLDGELMFHRYSRKEPDGSTVWGIKVDKYDEQRLFYDDYCFIPIGTNYIW